MSYVVELWKFAQDLVVLAAGSGIVTSGGVLGVRSRIVTSGVLVLHWSSVPRIRCRGDGKGDSSCISVSKRFKIPGGVKCRNQRTPHAGHLRGDRWFAVPAKQCGRRERELGRVFDRGRRPG